MPHRPGGLWGLDIVCFQFSGVFLFLHPVHMTHRNKYAEYHNDHDGIVPAYFAGYAPDAAANKLCPGFCRTIEPFAEAKAVDDYQHGCCRKTHAKDADAEHISWDGGFAVFFCRRSAKPAANTLAKIIVRNVCTFIVECAVIILVMVS